MGKRLVEKQRHRWQENIKTTLLEEANVDVK
jgi:hypothetical protein